MLKLTYFVVQDILWSVVSFTYSTYSYYVISNKTAAMFVHNHPSSVTVKLLRTYQYFEKQNFVDLSTKQPITLLKSCQEVSNAIAVLIVFVMFFSLLVISF